ncbi:bifunctional diaminohydroxyphosphoribosylaminopyrimidine deaminase/5-amino-6-(5-phosphoribosylamino)uracil reductase RibD [uncultured Pseudoteredinibacter sp.]|uniref:bifunctional diaminohydroxyphosphoribosylaminopyrimidine deaminase/5-amino-6-(5-phosphoribosylamino)uracil reductase RibD n=1 Tax=uncultured Pseudoteredinibacter sp. TaxID=1641701 RepID=UPI002638CEAF|nr:bifunctional diaminohydroxyphosphoribosylaminopyrimidine deaminase/5-amino-6-(5-phosphoribosylamino)uracil reductase RibD [uncultured Pseudoteredinibacter sp.]
MQELDKSSVQQDDEHWMARAIELAKRGQYSTMPNPRVGCVMVKNGQLLSEGWHQKPGLGHAEVEAIAAANNAGTELVGATAYVTLEPCSHHGKTGPCCEALAAVGVARVVFGMEDPNPQVSARGLEYLKERGIVVDGPVLEEDCRALNPGFIARMMHGRPLLRLKLAMSLDARTAMANGESKWITSAAARSDVQRLRASSCAVVSGIESILHDNPAMNVRANDLGLDEALCQLATEKQPLRVILDSALRMDPKAQLLSKPGKVLICTLEDPACEKAQELRSACTELEVIQAKPREGRIDLHWLVTELGRRECNEVLVETGASLAGSFLRRGLLDELIIYMAPKLLGSKARPIFELPLDTMAAHLPLMIESIEPIGQDWKILARPDIES